MDKIATLIRDNLPGYRGHAALYKLSEPLNGYTFVVVSSVYIEFPESVRNIVKNYHESFVFPSDSEGNVTEWQDLNGSISRSDIPVPHKECLSEAGYNLVYQ